jgi:dihydropteroate synthase-like protein
MKSCILLVTGRRAASWLERHFNSRVHICQVDVAGLLSLDRIGSELSGMDLSGFSMVLIPGLVPGDASELSKRLGVPVYKGTKHASEIPLLLWHLDELQLSTKLPADVLLEEWTQERVQSELAGARTADGKFLMKIGRRNFVPVGGDFPVPVIAEIPDAPLLSKKELKTKADYYVKSGAGIIDIGMMAGVDNSGVIPGLVKAVKSAVNVPVSIDSMSEDEIASAVDSGVDLVLSIGEGNQNVARGLDVPFVVVPTDKTGRLPASASERVRRLAVLAKNFSGKKIILDPVLSPLNYGFVESIKAFSLLRRKYPKTPLLMGAGNVTELVDADSTGMNALLAGIAAEIGIDLLFTVEASVKTRGCVRELSVASEMMFLSKKRGTNPKDFGIDLLALKDKRAFDVVEDPLASGMPNTEALDLPIKLDRSSYRIYILDGVIIVVEYLNARPVRKFKGKTAEPLCKTILSRAGGISIQHAAYLGRELAKAEIALRLGKNYVQDEELFS